MPKTKKHLEQDEKRQNDEIGSSVKDIVRWYEDSVAYQTGIGLRTSVPRNVRFYEGDQWPQPTKATQHFPRPVVNIIEMICDNKKSQILSSPIKLVYKSEADDAAVAKFNRFAEFEQTRIRQRDLNNKAALDGIIKGSYCFYYHWDSDVVGLDGLVEGDLGAQIFEPLDVHFADPSEKDEQKQEWIILVSREDVEKIKEMADEDVDHELINDDPNDSVYNEVESETTKYATVFTRFFRHDDEVYWERATRGVMFQKARPHTPDHKLTMQQLDGIEQEPVEPNPADKFLKKEPRATLYPIVFSSWKERDKSIYGRGEVEKLIPNQKAINWNWGLQLLMSQDEAMGAIIVHPNALKGQQITNEPGQVITDYSNQPNGGIRRLSEKALSTTASGIASSLTEVTRVVSGASEVMSGEVIGANMSGAAIAQLQAQALKPIEDLQKGFWRSIERVGSVIEQFLRFFFTKKQFQHTEEMPGGEEQIHTDTFDSDAYKDVRFDVVAEAIAGTVMSDVADINILDGLFAGGHISLKTYINNYPPTAISNRQKLLESIEAEQQETVNQLTQQIEQMQAQLKEAMGLIGVKEKVIDDAKKIADENRVLKETIISLKEQRTRTERPIVEALNDLMKEYKDKIMQANLIIAGMGQAMAMVNADAIQMAEEVAANRGIAPQQQPNTGFTSQGNTDE